jgi:hypothetical protein
MTPDRLLPQRPFPAYAFLPGRDPHPTRDPAGHSAGNEDNPPPKDLPKPHEWPSSPDYLYGIDLYNYGYLWEAHEAWEGLWHLAKNDPDSQRADFLQGLIQCAAATLKVLMGQPRGVVALAGMGTERLARVATHRNGDYMNLDVTSFVEAFRTFAASQPEDIQARPMIVLDH